MRRIYDFAPSEQNPRNSEGDFYRRSDGKIGFVYSRFTSGREDFSRSDLFEAVLSEDGTRVLPEGRVLFTTEQFGAQNIMCPSFLTLPDGRLLLFFLVRMGPGHINPWLYESFDGGQTFVNGREIAPGDRYIAAENGRALLTRAGKIVYWCSEGIKKEGSYAGISPYLYAVCLTSDDGGKTFKESRRYESGENVSSGLQEAGAAELESGRLLAWARTSALCQFLARSDDGGESYSEFAPCPLFPSPLSPMSMQRLKDGRVIAVYNSRPPLKEELEQTPSVLWTRRSPLVYRLTRDGEAWTEPRELEKYEESKNYCYTSIFAEKDFILLGYCASDMITDGGNLSRLRITRLETAEII